MKGEREREREGESNVDLHRLTMSGVRRRKEVKEGLRRPLVFLMKYSQVEGMDDDDGWRKPFFGSSRITDPLLRM